MADRDDFRSRAAAHNGKIVVWINQSKSPTLKAVNSRGVCHAIALDWIASYRKYLDDRAKFVNGFRQYDKDGKMVGYSIPTGYLARQAAISRELASFKERRSALLAKTVRYKQENPTEKDFAAALDETLRIFIRLARGGADCLGYTTTGTVDSVVTQLTNLTAPGYYLLALQRPGGGHAVAFEFRPDQSAGSFPGIFEFIDANSGLFVFGKASDMLTFFWNEVWDARVDEASKPIWGGYENYTTLQLFEFDTGAGGFLTKEQVARNKELAEQALQAEIEEMEKEMEQQYGKDWWKKK